MNKRFPCKYSSIHFLVSFAQGTQNVLYITFSPRHQWKKNYVLTKLVHLHLFIKIQKHPPKIDFIIEYPNFHAQTIVIQGFSSEGCNPSNRVDCTPLNYQLQEHKEVKARAQGKTQDETLQITPRKFTHTYP